jgi:hypothetical protein
MASSHGTHGMKPVPSSSEPINDLVALAVELNHDHTIRDRSELISKLFSGVSWDERDHVTWQGQKFSAVRNDGLRQKLFQLLGCGLDLPTVDRNIHEMLALEYGWLEQTSDDTVIIKSGEITSQLDQICQMILSSLNRDLVTKLRLLLQNIHSILTSETYFGQTSHIDVNLFQNQGNQLTVVHTRYFSTAKQRGLTAFFLGGNKRSIEISFALRKVGINKAFAEDITSNNPSVIIKNGRLERIPRPAHLSLPESHALQTSQSVPNSMGLALSGSSVSESELESKSNLNSPTPPHTS